MKQRIVILISLGVLVLLSCTGCAHWTGLVRAPVKDVSASQIIAALRDNRSGLRSFRGEANVHLQSLGNPTNQPFSHRLLAGILFKSPARMRVEVYAGLGTNILAFVQKDNQLDVFLPESKVLFTGDVGTDILAQATGIESLREMMFETLGLFRTDHQDVTSFQRSGDEYALSFQKDGHREEYRIDGRTLQVIRKEVFRTGNEPGRKVTFREHKKINGVYLPQQVEIVSDELKIKVEFIRQQVNVKIAGEEFELRVPADAQRVQM